MRAPRVLALLHVPVLAVRHALVTTTRQAEVRGQILIEDLALSGLVPSVGQAAAVQATTQVQARAGQVLLGLATLAVLRYQVPQTLAEAAAAAGPVVSEQMRRAQQREEREGPLPPQH